MKKTRNILVSLLACLFVILAVPTAVSAAAKAPQCPKKQTLEFYRAHTSRGEVPTAGDGYIYIKNLSRSAVITNVRSSNKYYTASKAAGLNAIFVQTTSGPDPIHYAKDGEKTKLRFTVKQNGKSYNLSCAVTFKKHSRVFKSVKIGSKNYAALAKGHWTVRDKGTAPKSKVKITVKTVKNYKVDSIEIFYKNKSKKIKNGRKVSLKNATTICINYHITAKPKYYKKPTTGYRGYFFGGTVKSPLYESFYLEYEGNMLAPQ